MGVVDEDLGWVGLGGISGGWGWRDRMAGGGEIGWMEVVSGDLGWLGVVGGDLGWLGVVGGDFGWLGVVGGDLGWLGVGRSGGWRL